MSISSPSAADGAPATAIAIKAIERFEVENALNATLYRSIALAAASPALQEPATELLVSFARHTALLIPLAKLDLAVRRRCRFPSAVPSLAPS